MVKLTAPAWMALAALFLSQVTPIFVEALHVGNWFPLLLATTAAFFAILMSPKNAGISNRYIRRLVGGFVFIGVPQILLIAVVSSPENYRYYADAMLYIASAVFLCAGCLYVQEAAHPWKGFIYLVLYLIVLTSILFLLFIINDYGWIQQIYYARKMWRFPGNWRYSYDLVVALIGYMLCLGYVLEVTRKFWVKLMLSTIILYLSIIIVVAQSRSGIVALIMVLVLLFCMKNIFPAFTKGRIHRIKSSSIIIGVILASLLCVLFFIFRENIKVILEFAIGRFYDYNSASDLASSPRIERIQYAFSVLSENPASIIWGLGRGSEGDIWIESMFLSFFRYGLVGFALKVFVVPFVIVGILKKYDLNEKYRNIIKKYFIWVFAAYIIGLVSPIIGHFRFLPLFFFVSGMIIGCIGKSDAMSSRDVATRDFYLIR